MSRSCKSERSCSAEVSGLPYDIVLKRGLAAKGSRFKSIVPFLHSQRAITARKLAWKNSTSQPTFDRCRQIKLWRTRKNSVSKHDPFGFSLSGAFAATTMVANYMFEMKLWYREKRPTSCLPWFLLIGKIFWVRVSAALVAVTGRTLLKDESTPPPPLSSLLRSFPHSSETGKLDYLTEGGLSPNNGRRMSTSSVGSRSQGGDRDSLLPTWDALKSNASEGGSKSGDGADDDCMSSSVREVCTPLMEGKRGEEGFIVFLSKG